MDVTALNTTPSATATAAKTAQDIDHDAAQPPTALPDCRIGEIGQCEEMRVAQDTDVGLVDERA